MRVEKIKNIGKPCYRMAKALFSSLKKKTKQKLKSLLKFIKSNAGTIIFGLISLGIIALFICNRFDKEIIKWFWTVVVVGVAFTLLSWAPQLSETLRQVRNNKSIFAFCIFLILFVSFIVSFLIIPNLHEESGIFYLYLIHNKGDNSAFLLNDPNRFFAYINYWDDFVSGHPNLETNIPFWQDYLAFLIARNWADRYRDDWFVQDKKEPLSKGGGLAPKGYELPIKTTYLTDNDIKGFEKNLFVQDDKIKPFYKEFPMQEKISVPKGTVIIFRKNVLDSPLSPFNYYKKNSFDKSFVDRFIIKNKFCEIWIDIKCLGNGVFCNEEVCNKFCKNCAEKRLDGARFKAIYIIKYNRYKIGNEKMIKFYKPWAEDLCSSFRKTFDIEGFIKNLKKNN